MPTTSCDLPKEVQDHFMCLLLHTKKAAWDGTYHYDELLKKNVPTIQYTCNICDKTDLNV